MKNNKWYVSLVSKSAAMAAALMVSGSVHAGTKMFVYVGSQTELRVFELDEKSGKMDQLQKLNPGASYGAFDRNSDFFYAHHDSITPGKVGLAEISAYSVDKKSGLLTKINSLILPYKGATHIAVHPTGRYLLTASFNDAKVSMIAVREDGGVGDVLQTVNTPVIQPHQAVVDRHGNILLVPCREGNAVLSYLIDQVENQLIYLGRVDLPTGPRHLDLDQSQKMAYLLNELSATLSTLEFDSASGQLTEIDRIPASDLSNPVRENASAHVEVDPSGRFLYASNRAQNNMAIFSIDPVSGKPTLLRHEYAGGLIKSIRDFHMDPTGRVLIVANEKAPYVLVFDIDQATGDLSLQGKVPAQANTRFIGIVK